MVPFPRPVLMVHLDEWVKLITNPSRPVEPRKRHVIQLHIYTQRYPSTKVSQDPNVSGSMCPRTELSVLGSMCPRTELSVLDSMCPRTELSVLGSVCPGTELSVLDSVCPRNELSVLSSVCPRTKVLLVDQAERTAKTVAAHLQYFRELVHEKIQLKRTLILIAQYEACSMFQCKDRF